MSILNEVKSGYKKIPCNYGNIIIPIANSFTGGVNYKEQYTDAFYGKPIYDENGIKHHYIIDEHTVWMKIPPVDKVHHYTNSKTGEKYEKPVTVLTHHEICAAGFIRDEFTHILLPTSDSNGWYRFKDDGFSFSPFKLAKQLFGETATKNAENIGQYKFILTSPAMSDNPNLAAFKPIIFEEPGGNIIIYNERQWSFLITNIPNRSKQYSKTKNYKGHIFREALPEEAETIYKAYLNFRDNSPKFVVNNCHYDRAGKIGCVVSNRPLKQ